jgi:hypothetical protein
LRSDAAAARQIDFRLVSTVPAASIAGAYTLTVTADAHCADLPAQARTRTYSASVTGSLWSPTTFFDVWVSGPSFLSGFDSAERFAISVAGDFVRFRFGSEDGQPVFVERLSKTAYLAIGGASSASIPTLPSSFTAALDGYVEYCEMKAATAVPVQGYLYGCATEQVLTRARCESKDHQVSWQLR